MYVRWQSTNTSNSYSFSDSQSSLRAWSVSQWLILQVHNAQRHCLGPSDWTEH